MKRIWALVVLAVLGFAVAGCGSAKKGGSAAVAINTVDSNSPSGAIFVTGTKAFVGLKVGTPIACKGGEPMTQVPPGAAVEGVRSARGSTKLDLTRSGNGTVTVSCGRE